MEIIESSILVVEDDLEIQSILKNLFSKKFSKVFIAGNGLIALDILKEQKPDLILTDLHMPEMNGIDFIFKLRAEGKNTPVIIVSSSKDREDLLKAVKLGANDFVEKPFKKVDVESAVYRVLEIVVRNKNLPELINRFGRDSQEVKKQEKLIGLLQAISAQS
jgi:CheY-like chemotaxis protein